jgi:hypothetical protein
VPSGRAQRDAAPHLDTRRLRHPLEQLGCRAASASRRQPRVSELDPGTLGNLTGTGRAVRVDQPAQRLELADRDK